jgi:hypothetical protein
VGGAWGKLELLYATIQSNGDDLEEMGRVGLMAQWVTHLEQATVLLFSFRDLPEVREQMRLREAAVVR